MGTQCANPDRPVFGIIGDGSAMMTVQGLWTAANDNIPCIFVICNNGMYRVLKVNFNIYQKDVLELPETSGGNLLYSDSLLPLTWQLLLTVWAFTGNGLLTRRKSSRR